MKSARTRDIVKRANLCHVSEAENKFVPYWYAPSYETGVPALRDNPNLPLVTPFDDVANFLCRARLEDSGGLSVILVHPVIVERLEFGIGGRAGR